MSSVLGLSHLAAPSAAVDSVAAAVVTAAATSNGQPDTPPPPPAVTTTTAIAAGTAGAPLLRVENGRSSFEHEEPNNQGENATMRHSSPYDNVFMQPYRYRLRGGHHVW